MRHSYLRYAALTTVTAGFAFAQAPAGNAQRMAPNTQEAPATSEEGPSVTGRLERMAQALNLTPSQRSQARVIFDQARTSARPILGEMRQNRMALTAAAKGGASEADINRLAADQGHLVGQLVGIRTQASAKFYQLLTPEQRTKFDQMHEQMREQMRERMRSRMHGGGGL